MSAVVDRVRAAYEAIGAVGRPEIWISLRSEEDVLQEARVLDRRVTGGERLPLAGSLLAVKNNVNVAGIATTAGCPAYAFQPGKDAAAVARLRAAGALVLGATNLDQFATGLVGTRSPHGAVRDARRPDRISGGSSSGSAVAVALGLVDIAIGTDTAGSGRVPAALQGIVGLKPTLGVVSTDGVVPACRSWDVVTIFARELATAERAMGIMAGDARSWPADTPLAAPPVPRVGYPRELPKLSPEWAAAFADAVERLRADGAELVEVELDVFLEAAKLLYDGGLVAERYAAVGEFVTSGASGIDPTVGGIITRAGDVPAHRYVADTEKLEALRAESLRRLDGLDALLIPTAPAHPLIDDVNVDPVGVNSAMGTYTNFCNLFDLCAVAVPSGTVTDAAGVSQFGVTVVAGTFHDAVAADIARRIEVPAVPPAPFPAGVAVPARDATPWPVTAGARAVPLVVVGAHRRGQPLASELERRGAYWDAAVQTASKYRLLALDTVPLKPGLVRSDDAGAQIAGERWLLSESALGSFLAELPAPMLMGSVELADGTWAVGFACDAEAMAAGRDITEYGDWLEYLNISLA